MRRPISILALIVVAAAAAASACGDLKAASPDDPGADAAADGTTANPGANDGAAPPNDGAAPPDAPVEGSARSGPGPHGSLPSGYCCTADTQCRYRHCVDPSGSGSGQKMCLDECYDPLFCTRPDLTFTCAPAVPGPGAGLCKPPAGFTCLDPSAFTRGPKEIGACCNAGVGGTNDGTAGSICEGYTCMSSADNPLICTHRCAFQSDCPGGYVCDKFGTSKACLRVDSPYTCTP